MHTVDNANMAAVITTHNILLTGQMIISNNYHVIHVLNVNLIVSRYLAYIYYCLLFLVVCLLFPNETSHSCEKQYTKSAAVHGHDRHISLFRFNTTHIFSQETVTMYRPRDIRK